MHPEIPGSSQDEKPLQGPFASGNVRWFQTGPLRLSRVHLNKNPVSDTGGCLLRCVGANAKDPIQVRAGLDERGTRGAGGH